MDISFLVRCMLDVCYMFEQHITCFKPFVQGRLKGVMLYGYMFLRHLPPKGGFCGCSDATCCIHSLGCAG